MPNPENIRGKGFDKHPENINKKGYPKGVKNRSTILKELLAIGDTEKEVNNAIIKLALQGDVRAYQEIMDTVYGKNKDVKIVDLNVDDLSNSSTEDLIKRAEAVKTLNKSTK